MMSNNNRADAFVLRSSAPLIGALVTLK